MKIYIKLALPIVLMSIFSNSALASDRTIEQVYKECGIGGLLFGKNSPTLAFISNVTWDLGTTAATSDATNGCAVNSHTTAAVLIHETYESLEQDIAIGSGEYFNALTSLMDCSSKNSKQVNAEIRNEFSEIIDSNDYQVISELERSDRFYQAVLPLLAKEKVNACSVS